jgi:hypothetical protein
MSVVYACACCVPPMDMMKRSVASSMPAAVIASMPAAAAADNSSADSGAGADAGAETANIVQKYRDKRGERHYVNYRNMIQNIF